MPSLKDLRNRIASVKSTQKITRAMQMVAAAKLRRAQDSAERSRPYAERMNRMMASVAGNLPSLEGAPPLMVGSGNDETHLLVVFTAERGLCGSFNTAVIRATRREVAALRQAGKTVKLLLVGRKGYDALRRDLAPLITDYITLRSARNIGFAEATQVSAKVTELFEAGEFDVCSMVYNAFKSVMVQEVTRQQLIPLSLPEAAADEDAGAPELGGAIYEFEPEETELLAELVPRNLSIQLFRALLEGAAAEQAARMTAMDNATRNAGDMIDALTLNYNRTRQANITKELIEIVSGAEAL
ncbi:MAG: F0F1 ATP synthase subunit gamma [Alphaproteobacteria bacterium]